MNPSTEVKVLTDLHTIDLNYSGFSSDQERWAYASTLKTYLASTIAAAVAAAMLTPEAQIGFTDNPTGTVITSTTVPTKILGTTTAGILQGFTATNGRLTLTAPTARVAAIISASVTDGNNHVISLYIAKNGTAVLASKDSITVGPANNLAHISSSLLIDMVAGDFIEAFILNETTLSTVTVKHLSLTIR